MTEYMDVPRPLQKAYRTAQRADAETVLTEFATDLGWVDEDGHGNAPASLQVLARIALALNGDLDDLDAAAHRAATAAVTGLTADTGLAIAWQQDWRSDKISSEPVTLGQVEASIRKALTRRIEGLVVDLLRDWRKQRLI